MGKLFPSGEWDGVCACGKVAMDGIRCRLGATHRAVKSPTGVTTQTILPWAVPKPKEKLPWD
jgi:hypothetical protein